MFHHVFVNSILCSEAVSYFLSHASIVEKDEFLVKQEQLSCSIGLIWVISKPLALDSYAFASSTGDATELKKKRRSLPVYTLFKYKIWPLIDYDLGRLRSLPRWFLTCLLIRVATARQVLKGTKMTTQLLYALFLVFLRPSDWLQRRLSEQDAWKQGENWQEM